MITNEEAKELADFAWKQIQSSADEIAELDPVERERVLKKYEEEMLKDVDGEMMQAMAMLQVKALRGNVEKILKARGL